jgi:tripartite-type tricarboxylate transporter receptor subunit TctC
MGPQRTTLFPEVPTLKEAMNIGFTTGAWRGFAGPKGLPQEVAGKLTATLKKIYDSKEYKDFMSSRGFGVVWGDAAAFAGFMDNADKQMGEAMKAAGIAKT